MEFSESDSSDLELILEDGTIEKSKRPPKIYPYKNRLCVPICDKPDTCNNAHSLSEQNITESKLYCLRILLDNNIMNMYELSANIHDVYGMLITQSIMCSKCFRGKCNGGYNCPYGTNDSFLCVCEDNLLFGTCDNPVSEHIIPDNIKNNISVNKYAEKYIFCKNGQHLSNRGLIPYNKYRSQQIQQ